MLRNGQQRLPSVAYKRGFWAAFLTFAGHGEICFEESAWCLRTGEKNIIVLAKDVSFVQIKQGAIWSKIVVHAKGQSFVFPGLSHAAAIHLRGVFQVHWLPKSVAEALSSWSDLVNRHRYMNYRSWSRWQRQHESIRGFLREAETKYLPSESAQMALRFSHLHDDLHERVIALNQQHLRRELSACKEFFDSVERNPLTAKQREALITDEDNTLVVAGAGTGKTSVVVGKVGYLVQRLNVPPSEILLLAYNKAAAKEMQERVDERIGVDLNVSTFHALGLSIIGEVEGPHCQDSWRPS